MSPSSRVGSGTPVSRVDSGTPVSRVGSVAPVSWGGAPTTSTTSSVPLRASQIVQRAHHPQPRSLSRTISVHDLNATSRTQGFSIPAPPPYGYHPDEDGIIEYSGDRGDSPSQCAGRLDFDGIDIDEISPDEDERIAEAALHAPGMHFSFFKLCTDNTTILLRKALHFNVQILAPWNPMHQRSQVCIFPLSDSLLLTQLSERYDEPQDEQELSPDATRPADSQIGKNHVVS